jgi:hypothetical protein
MQCIWNVIATKWCTVDWIIGLQFPVGGLECFSSPSDHSPWQWIFQDKVIPRIKCEWIRYKINKKKFSVALVLIEHSAMKICGGAKA